MRATPRTPIRWSLFDNMTLKWKIIVAIAVVGFAGAVLFHAPLLRGLADPLIVDQTTDDYDSICLLPFFQAPDGDRCYEVAADLFRKNPSAQVLVVDLPPNRIKESGALPSFETISRRELGDRGVPGDSISILRSQWIDDWATAETLAVRLRERPESSVLLLCAEFHSARVRAVLDDVLDPAEAARVWVMPLPDRRFDQTNWWTSRCGVREFGMNWLIRLQGWLGGQAAHPPRKSADDYRRDIIKSWREETP